MLVTQCTTLYAVGGITRRHEGQTSQGPLHFLQAAIQQQNEGAAKIGIRALILTGTSRPPADGVHLFGIRAGFSARSLLLK